MGRRARLLRWFLIGLAILAVVCGATVWGVGCRASRQIEDRIQAIRAAGDPASLEEAAPPPIPDEENAAVPLAAAFRVLDEARREEEEAELEDESPYPYDAVDSLLEDPWSEEEGVAEGARAWALRRDAVRPSVEAALARSRCRFEAAWIPIRESEDHVPRHIEALIGLGQWVLVRAALAARDGDANATYAALQDALRLPGLASPDGTLLLRLVRGNQEKQALRLLEAVSSRHALPRARREAFARAVPELEDPGALARTLIIERCFAIEAFHHIDELADLDGVRSLVPQLVFRLDEARYLELAARAIDLARRPYAETREAWAALERDLLDRSWYEVFTLLFMSVQPMCAERETAHLAVLRLAQLALSIERARRDDGSLPADLGRDVKWIDPGDGHPLRCKSTKDGGYLLWSVGPDREDDGGWDEDTDEPHEEDITWEVAGRLSPWPR